MRKSFEFLDIFEFPIKRTREAREREYKDIVRQLQNVGSLSCPHYLGKLAFLTSAGYVSGRVASYFLAGKVTSVQKNVLSYFMNFLNDYSEDEMVSKSLFYLSSWHNVIKDVVVENTFLFPLAELACNDCLATDFVSERNEL